MFRLVSDYALRLPANRSHRGIANSGLLTGLPAKSSVDDMEAASHYRIEPAPPLSAMLNWAAAVWNLIPSQNLKRRSMSMQGPVMPNYRKGEGRTRPVFSHWESLSAEVLSYNILVAAKIAECWRSAAEIPVALLSLAFALETPMDRRRKFTIVDGGRF
jgi:hypothetical protein